MSVFRASAVLALLSAGVLIGAEGVSAQSSLRQFAQSSPGSPAPGPVRLGPRRAVIPPPAVPSRESAPVTIEPREAPPQALSPSGEAGPVKVQMLQAVDADSVGVIDDKEGGLGVDMWGNIDRNYIGRVVALLPRDVRSPTMRNLIRRLLLTRAIVPPRTAPGPALLPLRIDALVALGDLDAAMSLISRAPIAPLDEHLLRTEVESRFFRHDTTGACAQVRASAQDYKSDYWQQAMAYCLALAGKTAEASLLSDILAERSSGVHPAFFAAMDRLSGAPPPEVESLAAPSALYLSMMRTASLALPGDVVQSTVASVQNAVALSPNAALELRLAAAEKAALQGNISGKTLVEIYRGVPSDDSTLEDMLKRAEAEWGATGRALLIRAAEGQTGLADRARVVQQALRIAREKGGYGIVVAASGPWLESLTPTADLGWFAGTAARALIAAGAFDAASRWIELGTTRTSDTSDNQDRTPAPKSLWPLAVLSGNQPVESITPAALVAWWRARNQAGAPGMIEDARTFYALLDTMDVTIPSVLWTPILGVAPSQDTLVPDPSLQSALRRAAMAGRKGEVVGLALVALGETGTTANNLHAVRLAVRALRSVGLVDEARRLVLETAVAAGL